MKISSEHRLNPESIRVLSWNVKKQSRPQLNADLAGFSQSVDLALLQEVHKEGEYLQHFCDKWHRSFAPGFTLPGRTTGVMNVSNVCHRSQNPLRHSEPLFRTSKAANMTTYDLTGETEALLAVNLHAVNFSLGMNAYTRQLRDMLQHIDEHRGPVIFAGDFNAWRDQRKQLLDEIAHRHGLTEVGFEEDKRSRVFGRHLDYIFVRGLRVHDAHTLHSDASDHNPLLATLGL
ncbi:MAG: endonuclease/exonuclease/phosphatase (EEP) superfamily protein YafD [Pseudohongiellaceae bacterium]|jgi:endonuclease/exonuclease/phosphatase (EEP) superfamily protein YafD